MTTSLQNKMEQFIKNAKILFVDDDANLLHVIRETLGADGFEIFTATNGQEGVEQFEKIKPDLIFLDVQMPVMDGLTALNEIKKRKPDQHVVILSGHDDVNVAFDAIRQGAYDFI